MANAAREQFPFSVEVNCEDSSASFVSAHDHGVPVQTQDHGHQGVLVLTSSYVHIPPFEAVLGDLPASSTQTELVPIVQPLVVMLNERAELALSISYEETQEGYNDERTEMVMNPLRPPPPLLHHQARLNHPPLPAVWMNQHQGGPVTLRRDLASRDSQRGQGHHDYHSSDSPGEQLEHLDCLVQSLEMRCQELKHKHRYIEMRIQALQYGSCDGEFLWKISDVTRLHQEAVAGRTISLYSPPFYAGRYRMCLRLYLKGDGSGQGTHLSLFYVLMRGEFDALLHWPFEQLVTATLIAVDQARRQHISHTFRPDSHSSSFHRPQTEMNIPSGCPQFAPVGILLDSSYVAEDTMFIRVRVDLTDLNIP